MSINYESKPVTPNLIKNYSLLLYSCVIIAVVVLMLPSISVVGYSSSSTQVSEPSSTSITYSSTENIITITCKSANLTAIDNQLRDPDILHKETTGNEYGRVIWLLNAAMVIEKGATLYINSTDTSWLRIVAPNNERTTSSEEELGGGDDNEENPIAKANGIQVFGSLKIDSVKMTSWDLSANNYAISEGKRNLKGSEYEVELGFPRPFISVEGGATGTTDITNSEIAYLGYEGGVGGGPVVGLTYFGGDGSIIANNNIHHLYFAFYSNGIGNITIENNHIHNSGHYGLDPHTGTHDMIIRNNTIEDNGSIGIICSLDCYNTTIENNRVSNNTRMGIMLSRNMYDSVVRNNIVSDEERSIVISESHNNEIYNNTVTNSGRGIDIDKESYQNIIHDNIIKNIPNPSDALYVEDEAAEQNTLYSNILLNADQQRTSLDQ